MAAPEGQAQDSLPPADASGDPNALTELLGDLETLWREGLAQMAAIKDLLAMETRLALSSLKVLVLVGMIFGLGLFVTWWLIVGALCYALIAQGVPVSIALTVCALANAGLTLWLYYQLKRIARNLDFSELRAFLADGGNGKP